MSTAVSLAAYLTILFPEFKKVLMVSPEDVSRGTDADDSAEYKDGTASRRARMKRHELGCDWSTIFNDLCWRT